MTLIKSHTHAMLCAPYARGYTLAFADDLLVACYKDGGDLQAELDHEYNNGGLKLNADDVDVYTGVLLTNDDTLGNEVIYIGHDNGWLTDEHGTVYERAVSLIWGVWVTDQNHHLSYSGQFKGLTFADAVDEYLRSIYPDEPYDFDRSSMSFKGDHFYSSQNAAIDSLIG